MTTVDGLGVPEEIVLCDLADLSRARAFVRRRARGAGLSEERTGDLILAVHESAAYLLVAGTAPVVLVVSETSDQMVCGLRATGTVARGSQPPASEPESEPLAEAVNGWRIAYVLCDEFSWKADGAVLWISTRLDGQDKPPTAGRWTADSGLPPGGPMPPRF